MALSPVVAKLGKLTKFGRNLVKNGMTRYSTKLDKESAKVQTVPIPIPIPNYQSNQNWTRNLPLSAFPPLTGALTILYAFKLVVFYKDFLN